MTTRTPGLGRLFSMVLWCELIVACGGEATQQSKVVPCPTVAASGTTASGSELLEANPAPATLRVTLPSAAGGRLPQESSIGAFGCAGSNVSPAVAWEGAPATTKSFAVIMHDPDAPTGVGFFHWSVIDIPASASQLAAGTSSKSLPAGSAEGYTDYGATGYGGPCPPPSEVHRYVVTVYAVDVPKLGAPPSSTGALLRFLLSGHTLALGRATATFGPRAPSSAK